MIGSKLKMGTTSCVPGANPRAKRREFPLEKVEAFNILQANNLSQHLK
jgi:hypothetical protein